MEPEARKHFQASCKHAVAARKQRAAKITAKTIGKSRVKVAIPMSARAVKVRTLTPVRWMEVKGNIVCFPFYVSGG